MASGMEWPTRNGMTPNAPIWISSPGLRSSSGLLWSLCSLILLPRSPRARVRRVDRHAWEVGQHVRQAADVVLVGVGDQECLDVLAAFLEVGDVGHDEVDAEHLLVGEHEPAVDDDDLVAVLEDVAVLADLADAAERDDAQRLRSQCQRWCVLEEGELWRGSDGADGTGGAGALSPPRSREPFRSWLSIPAVSEIVAWTRSGDPAAALVAPVGAVAAASPPSKGSCDSGAGASAAMTAEAVVVAAARSAARRVAALARLHQRQRDTRHVAERRLLHLGRPERGGRVVHRVGQRVGRARRRIHWLHRAVRRRDPCARHERAHREPSQRHDQRRVEHGKLPPQERRAGSDLVGLRVAIVGWPALHDIRDEHVLPSPAHGTQQLHRGGRRRARRTVGLRGPR